MKSSSTIFGQLVALAFGGTTAILAAIPENVPPVTFDEGRGVIQIAERLRLEDRSNNFDFNSAVHSANDDSWLLHRLRLGLTWKPDAQTSVQVGLQDSREFGSDRPNVPYISGAEGTDVLDLQLAAVTWGNPATAPVSFTLGRQSLAFGDERLVGPGDWGNLMRAFDGAKVIWNLVPGKTTVTFFATETVHIGEETGGNGWKFNNSGRGDLFSGAYLSHKLTPKDTLETYVFWRNKSNNGPIYTTTNTSIPVAARTTAPYDIGQDVVTFGARFVRGPKPGAFDHEYEAAYQAGNVDRQTLTNTGPYGGNRAKLDQAAWAIHGLLGYTPDNVAWKPRLSVEYNVASGDTNRADGKNGSFMGMFPSNHKFYGTMDAFAWKNIREAVASVRFVPVAKTTLRIDYHRFSLYTDEDAWYRANGVATVRPLNAAAQSAPTRVGDEIDINGSWTPRPWAAIDIGYAHFLSGAYLSATGARSDADFFYLQTTLKL
ncbi:MAG: alginate export family protein [Lacunisphaera sp.]